MFLGLSNVKNITIFLKKHIEITYRKAEIIRFMCSVSLNHRHKSVNICLSQIDVILEVLMKSSNSMQHLILFIE